MNIVKPLIAAASLAVIASSAFAQEATPDTWISDAQASKKRQQVNAELAAARKDGTINAGSATYNFVGRAASTKTRDQVRAELAEARASGEYDALNSEAHALGHGPTPKPTYATSGSHKVR
jgi:hypothetical protein